MYPYLYLAPRGQAKTYEAAIFAANESRKGFKIAVFLPHERLAQNFRQRLVTFLGDCRGVEVFTGLENAESVSDLTVRIFDEFDQLFDQFKGEFEIRPTDRFYGTPRKRNLLKLPEDDILVKVLDATKGHYYGRMWPICFDNNILKKAKKEMPKDQFDNEFLGNFWEVEE